MKAKNTIWLLFTLIPFKSLHANLCKSINKRPLYSKLLKNITSQFPRFLTLLYFLTPPMDELNLKRSHVPAFGSWDCDDDLPFTQCFESARQAGLLRYSYSADRDLYVAGDLYDNHAVTPAMIVVPRHRGKSEYPKKKQGKKDEWVVCDCECEMKRPPSPVGASPAPPHKPPTKAVDEDLYKISPDLLRAEAKKKKAWSFFSSCLPTCLI